MGSITNSTEDNNQCDKTQQKYETLHIKDSQPDIWILEDASYIVKEGKPIILLFSRNYRNKFETATHFIHDFEPYFYCPAGETSYNSRIKRIEKDILIDADGRKINKVVTFVPKDVPEVRTEFTFTDMADFLFEKRFMIDKGITYAYMMEDGQPIPTNIHDILLPRILYFDIEVRSPAGVFPPPHYPKYSVVSIQTLDSYTNKILVFTAGIPPTQDPQHCACNDEADLFKAFMDYLKDKNPDVLTGWNTCGYDLPYLIKRAEEIGVSCKNLGRIGFPRANLRPTGEWDIMIKGRATLDMLPAFKKLMIMKSERESYALKEVCKDYGFEYIDYGPKIDELFNKQDWSTFIQYGKNDVIALKTIDEHTDVSLFAFYETVRMIAGTRIDDVLYNSRLIEMTAMHMGIKPMRTKAQDLGTSEKFEGALVLLPDPGIHENVGTVDLASLYPTIMRAFPNETSPDADHVFINMLEVFVNEREKLRAQRLAGDDSPGTALKEYAYKVLANSVYGVAGARTFRQYKREAAEFVTATGRELGRYIHYCLSLISKNTIYGDSVTGDTIVRKFNKDKSSSEEISIESLFTQVNITKTLGGEIKEYCNCDFYVQTIDKHANPVFDRVQYIMRHLTTKQLYKVHLANNSSIIVTEDHSVFIYNLYKGTISTVKTKNIFGKHVVVNTNGVIGHTKVIKLEKLGTTNQYVYDLHTSKSHKFFANDILVHNTDSAFFYPVESPVEGLSIQDYLNNELLKWGREKGARIPFTLKFEKLYKTILFKVDSSGKRAAKKKYCGHLIWEEGKDKNELNYKGLELKRSDQPNVSKECLRKFLELTLISNDADGAVDYVKTIYNDSINGKVSPFDISIPRAIRTVGANSPHSRGIINTKTYYEYLIQDGSKPRLLYLQNHPYEVCIDEDMPLDRITPHIDWFQMTEKAITMKMKSYITSIGRNWDEIIYNQKTLSDFF